MYSEALNRQIGVYFKGIYVDNGCKDAKSFVGHKIKCKECPFGDCINTLKPKEKQLILQSNTVQTALMYHDLGMTINEIALLIQKATQSQIKYWIDNRDRIEEKIKRYSPVGIR